MSQVATFTDYKVKDLSLADWGRKEITLAENEMPGLMALRQKYGKTKLYQSGEKPALRYHFFQYQQRLKVLVVSLQYFYC